MAIILAILRLFLCHLLSKIPTVFFAGVGSISSSHVRAVPIGKVMGRFLPPLHDVAVPEFEIYTYKRVRFEVFFIRISNSTLIIYYPLRFYLFWFLMADNIRRALQQINLGIEDTPVSLPQAVVHQAAEDNRFCLMGRPLMLRKQNLRQIVASLPRSWGLIGFVRGRIVEQRRFQFIFPSEESLETVLRRGPWSFADRMLVLQRWTPDLNPLSLNFIPFWIQIRGIPLQYMNLGVIDSIAGSLGERMEVDFDESVINRVQFVRVRINWNVDRPLRFQRNYQFVPGVNTVLSFFYERLRGFCDVCGMMTHDSGSCLIQNGGPNMSDDENDDDEDEVQGHGNPGVHIQELYDDGEPIVDIEAVVEGEPQEVQNADSPAEEGNLSDIDPNHDSMAAISSDQNCDFPLGEWENVAFNPIPAFANATGAILSPFDLLKREIRKRKQESGSQDQINQRRRKTGSTNQTCSNNIKMGSGSGGNPPPDDRDRAAVGPVPPPAP